MDKLAKKQKAMELFQNGLSYGKIADQLGEPKTTVHRWINSLERSDGTNDNFEWNETNPDASFQQLPEHFTKKLVTLLSGYISFDNCRFTGEMIIYYESSLEKLKSEVKAWALNNNIKSSTISENKVIREFLDEVKEQFHLFFEEASDEFILDLDRKWRKKFKKWVKLNK
jgi:hypothetical protein